jgi:excisionase family DNA binding protein
VAAELTLQEAAQLLGVHYMTAYRYVRLGMLPAEKVGGTWRVSPAMVEQLRGAALKGAAAEAVSVAAARRRAPWADRLECRLVSGDAGGAWAVIEAALASGAELDEVYLTIIAPAMRGIGARWQAGELDVAVEHRASGIVFRIIGRLGHRFRRRGRSRGAVVVGAPVGERHAIPVALLTDLLRGAGWDVSDLGADVPTSSFADAIGDVHGLAAVGVSVTTSDCLPAAAEAIAAVRAVAADVPILAGGHAVRDERHASALGADGWAPDGRAAVCVLDAFVGATA